MCRRCRGREPAQAAVQLVKRGTAYVARRSTTSSSGASRSPQRVRVSTFSLAGRRCRDWDLSSAREGLVSNTVAFVRTVLLRRATASLHLKIVMEVLILLHCPHAFLFWKVRNLLRAHTVRIGPATRKHMIETNTLAASV